MTLTTPPLVGLPVEAGFLPLDGALASAPSQSILPGSNFSPTDSWVGQVVPGDETIGAISASFDTSTAGTLFGTFTVTAQIYVSSNGGATYSPLAGTAVTLAPSLTGSVVIGTISSGTLTGLSVSIPAGDLGMVVFSGSDSVTTESLTGSATAGVSYTSG